MYLFESVVEKKPPPMSSKKKRFENMLLQIDSREPLDLQVRVSNALERLGLATSVATLDTGDFAISVEHPDSREFLALVERKTYKDLSSSITDGRYPNQFLRMLETNIPILGLILEGDLARSGLTEEEMKRVVSATLHTSTRSFGQIMTWQVPEDPCGGFKWLIHTLFKLAEYLETDGYTKGVGGPAVLPGATLPDPGSSRSDCGGDGSIDRDDGRDDSDGELTKEVEGTGAEEAVVPGVCGSDPEPAGRVELKIAPSDATFVRRNPTGRPPHGSRPRTKKTQATGNAERRGRTVRNEPILAHKMAQGLLEMRRKQALLNAPLMSGNKKKTKATTPKDVYLTQLSAIPGMSLPLATAVAHKYTNMADLIRTLEEYGTRNLVKIQGIGKKRASAILESICPKHKF